MDVTVDVRGSLLKAKTILMSPGAAIKTIAKEKGFKSAFSYLLVVSVVGHIFTFIYSLIFAPSAEEIAQITGMQGVAYGPAEILTAIAVSFVITLGLSFVWSGAFKLILGMFKIESDFNSVYRILVYARTPFYLFSWLPLINIMVFFYSCYLVVLMLQKILGVGQKKAIVVVLTSIITLIIATGVIFNILAAI